MPEQWIGGTDQFLKEVFMGLTADKPLSFDNLGCGAAREQFDEALKLVLENIQDPNTPEKAVREITLKVKIKPMEGRKEADIEINVTPKVATAKAFPSRIFIGSGLQGAEAHEVNANQIDLFPKVKANVTSIAKGKEE
jgi:hypothetical protein